MTEIGGTMSHYKILEKLGEGGMGVVYRAEDTNLNRQVAVKVLPDIFSGDPERLARFERVARLLASLNHPNIATIHGLEQAEGKCFLVMDLVEGETLAQRLLKGPLLVEEALEVCRQIAEGVEAAHEKGVIHRDLKPANIKITPEGKVKILDFGLAKAFHEKTAAATFMSQKPPIPGSRDSLTPQTSSRSAGSATVEASCLVPPLAPTAPSGKSLSRESRRNHCLCEKPLAWISMPDPPNVWDPALPLFLLRV